MIWVIIIILVMLWVARHRARTPKNTCPTTVSVTNAGNLSVVKNEVSSDPEGLFAQQAKREKLNSQYADILAKHAHHEEVIGTLYTVARELSTYSSPQMDKVVELCIADIELAPQVIEYQKQFDLLYHSTTSETGYYFSTFKRLAIIYEKQQRYGDAIAICQRAIDLGVVRDGTEGGMIGRMARLCKKKMSAAQRITSCAEDREE